MRKKAITLANVHNWSSAVETYSDVGATGHGFNEESDLGQNNVWFKFQATTSDVDFRVLTGGSYGTVSSPYIRLFDASGTLLTSNGSDGVSMALIQYVSLTPGSDYYFAVDSQTPGSFSLQVNDSVGYDMRLKALLLNNIHEWSSANAQYSDVGATGHGFNEETYLGQNNVWFKFHAITSEVDFRVLTGGSYGTISSPFIRLFDASGTILTSNGSEGVTTGLVQYVTLTPGSDYYFAVDSSVPGTFSLQVNDSVGYDMRLKALLLSNIHNWSSANGQYSDVGATGHGFYEEPYLGQNNVWFKFQATSSTIDIRVLTGGIYGTSATPFVRLYDESGNQKTISVNENASTLAVVQYSSLTEGSYYYFVIDTPVPGTFTLMVSDEFNYDMRTHPVIIESPNNWASGDATYSNVWATGHGFNEQLDVAKNNVWYAFHAETNQINIQALTGDGKGTLSGIKVTLFDNQGNKLADSTSTFIANILYTSLVPDSLYYISVDDTNTPGTFTLQVQDELTNDFYSHALLISNVGSWTSGNAAFTNVNMTPDFTTSPCGGPFHNLWYKFQAIDSRLQIEVTSGGDKGTLMYPVITLFDSDSLSVDCNGGLHRAILDSVYVIPGNWYYLSVDNYQGSPGTFTLNIENNSYDSIPLLCTPEFADEYRALMDLYSATGGASWTNNTGWRDANPNVVSSFNGWYGIMTDSEGHVANLDLHGNGLSGTLPESIGDLIALTKLTLNNNQLRGQLPDEIGRLSCLKELSLEQNAFSGILPVAFADLTNLTTLKIANTSIGGIIPSAYGSLHKLTYVDMHGDSLSGPIPSSFEGLTGLTYLDLGSNQLLDSVPKFLGNFGELTTLRLGRNQFIGSIPSELGNLTKLKILNLGNNLLTDSLPSSLGNLHLLDSLNLQNNHLMDTVPASFANLTNLKKLYLNGNQLKGNIRFAQSLTALTELWLGDNAFYGEVPDLGELINLRILTLNDNQFTALPSGILSLIHLNLIDLNNNKLTSLPQFDAFSNKASLDLKINRNDLTFGAIIPMINAGFHSLDYAPQNLIDTEKTVRAAVGQPLTLTATIDRTTNPPSVYQWFKVSGGVETPLNAASTSGYTVTLPSMSQSDKGSRYIYKISNPAGTLVLVSHVQTYQIVVCNQLSVSIQSSRVDGKYLFTPLLSSLNSVCNLTYNWDFGDGMTSTEPSPSHAYTSGGTYAINLMISYSCDGCASGNTTAQYQITIDQAFCGLIYCDGDGIGIGTTQIPSGYKLAVKGKVIMEGAKVAMQARWPDYVFEKDYNLMDIQTLKEYIRANSHLPNVPSAENVKKEGIDIGEMNAVLLQKVEELTLYMIQLDEQVKKLEKDRKK